jgi:hypothetical protein
LSIPGDHGSAVYPRWRADVVSAIQQALKLGDGY